MSAPQRRCAWVYAASHAAPCGLRLRAGGQLAGLALAHRLGAVPRIRLYGAGGEGESARIDRWQLEDIEAYLADRLEGYAPVAAM